MRSITALTALTVATTAASALSHHSNDPNNHVFRRAHSHKQLAQRAQASSEHLTGRMHKRVRRQDASKLSSPSSTYSTTAIWYAESGWVTSCGETLTDDANFVGLPLELYPNVNEKSDLCGKTVVATNSATGQNITATVIDASNRQDYTIFSPSAFTALGGVLETGELAITFELVDAGDVALPSAGASTPAAAAAATKKTPSAGGAASTAGSDNTADVADVAAVDNVAAKVVKTTTTTAATTVAPVQTTTTTEAPRTTTTTTPAYDEEAAKASSSSKAAAAAAAASASTSASAEAQAQAEEKKEEAASYEAYQLAVSQTSAAQAAAASKSAADAAWASSSSAAAAAASKSAADAAWASSSSAAAAAAAAKPTAESSSSSGSSGSSGAGSSHVYTGGIATFFYQNGNAGNCGKVNPDSLPLVALPTNTYAGGSHCGQYVTIKRVDTGNTIKALVADSFADLEFGYDAVCYAGPTCNNDSCLDLSWGAFSGLGGTQSMGVFDIEWYVTTFGFSHSSHCLSLGIW
ncbi:hypothetical protein JCM11251_003971 [Rhodosporidiobolus azoricus]